MPPIPENSFWMDYLHSEEIRLRAVRERLAEILPTQDSWDLSASIQSEECDRERPSRRLRSYTGGMTTLSPLPNS